jgi:hypothetical protein
LPETGWSRRQVLALAGGTAGALTLGGGAAGALARPGSALAAGDSSAAADSVAATYHALLLAHTRWVEAQWDSRIGAYQSADFRFASVLGNAVLLTTPGYDATAAGVDEATLRAHTLATIKRYASTNRLAGGTDWGRQLFWDSTFELYFVLAARLLWRQLDRRTRSHIDAIVHGQATYAYQLGYRDDPMSPGWSPNGTQGGWVGDTKLEEMGVYAQALAPGLAWNEQSGWRDRFQFWVANMSGLPTADLANPAVRPPNSAHNIHDTFYVENHGSVNPHYQAELWRTAARSAIHFITAGKPVPAVLTAQPNARELWGVLKLLASDAGEPVMPMVADRYHLYGRDVLPLAFLAQMQGDRHAARAEADLAARLMPYLKYAPEYRLTKFSGEEKYEPEARAELAIAYLLHRHRRTPVAPVSPDRFFADASGTREFGTLTVQQTPDAFAAAVTQNEFINFLWLPRHDNWLVDTRATAFLPPSIGLPSAMWTTAYSRARDGVDATASMLVFGEEYAGFTTLPSGTVVYASTGVGSDEGGLSLFNLDMPGMPGLTGTRTYTGESGSVTLAGADGGGGDGGTDQLSFDPVKARYVRMLGISPANGYGYSIWTFSVYDEGGGDLAQGALATGSSEDVTYPARNATDGNGVTRWAVDRTQRGRLDSWLAVDLGSAVTIAGVRIDWEAAYATRYAIQTSIDAITWTTAVEVPQAHTIAGPWVDVDGRAGLVTHGSARAIRATATGVIAAAGSASPVLIEGYPLTATTGKAGNAANQARLARAASRRMPVGPTGLTVSDADGYVSLFNLTEDRIENAVVSLPSAAYAYRGSQTVSTTGLDWTVTIAGERARVEPPRFAIARGAPLGTRIEVDDSHDVTVTAPAYTAAKVTLHAPATDPSWSATVELKAGESRTLEAVFDQPVTPTADLALARTCYPTSPLPKGMTSPSAAVDGDPATSWRPGPTGRMVVDLAQSWDITVVKLTWTAIGTRRPVHLSASPDGLTYTGIADIPAPGRSAASIVDVNARYLAVAVDGWTAGDAELVSVEVR